jgi:hypothetical protein
MEHIMADKKAPEIKPAAPAETKLRKPSFGQGDEPKIKAPENKSNGPPAPDFKLAAQIIRAAIDGTAERRAKMNGDLSAAWKRVEDEAHVNKAAAKDARKIARMSDETQSDYLRSLFGLMSVLDIGIRRDLVDLAEGAAGLSIPLKDAPVSELEGGSVVAAAMRETKKADAGKPVPPTHPADDRDLADAGEAERRDALAGAALDKMAKG